MNYKNGRLDVALVIQFEDSNLNTQKVFRERMMHSWCPEIAKSFYGRHPQSDPFIQLYIERSCNVGYDDHPVDPSRYYSEGSWKYITPDEALDYFVSYNSN